MTPPKTKILRVAIGKVLPLRHRVLRAGMPPESACFDGDDASTTQHWAAIAESSSGDKEGQVVGCLSLMLNSFNGQPAWQLRGMAVDEARQRSGLGCELIQHAEAAVATEGKAGWLWCNARTPATGFYQKQGWTVVSDVFEIPTAGPHVKMSKQLNGSNLRETIEKARGQS